MRPILFRAKRKDNGEWVEGYYCVTIANVTTVPGNQHLIIRNDFIFGERFLIDPETLCQFTGLYDKNGEKIWEGDVVEFTRKIGYGYGNEKRKPYLLEWNCEGSYVGFGFRKEVAFTNKKSQLCIVIGNRFDNPELLFNNTTE